MKNTVLIIFITLCFISKAQTDTTEFESTMFRYETMPNYYGGQLQLMKDINTLAIYTMNAKNEKVEGRIYVALFVEADGSLSEIKLAKGNHPELDSIAVSVVKQINQKWVPGRQRGKPVRIKYMLPINFNLDNKLAKNDKPSGYWRFWGKKRLKLKFKIKYNLNENEFNCWYNFITNNYNDRKMNDLNLNLMFQKFNCKNAR